MSTFATSRDIAASIDQVFAAMSDPHRLARWWGPKDFANLFELCEFKTGGRWRFTMLGPGGKHFKNESEFALVEAPFKVVVQHVSEPRYRLTMSLTPSGATTHVLWEQVFEDAEIARRVEHIVVPANEENLDRLAAEVARYPNFPSDVPVRIEVASFVAAPLADVWRAYTTPTDIVQWNAASADWHTTSASVDLRVGGAFSSRMEAKDGSFGFDFAGTYVTVVEQRLIEYEFGGRLARVEFHQTPEGVRVNVVFDSESTHSIEQQRQGWQAILDNFAAHVVGSRSA